MKIRNILITLVSAIALLISTSTISFAKVVGDKIILGAAVSLTGKYYARFFVKHEDKNDSYLRKAYTNMDLHTDGTYVKEITDWLLMTKIEEQNVEDGETAMLHLDDREHCKEFFNDPVGKQDFIGGPLKVKI